MNTSLDTEGVFEVCPDAAALLDVDEGRIVAANSRCATLCGRSREGLLGTSPRSLSPVDWTPRASIGALVSRARDDRVTFDWRVERPDEPNVTLRCSMRSVPDEDGRMLVTARKHATDDRTAAGAVRTDGELQELLDGMNDAVLVVDTDGNFVDANRVASERLGYTRAELLSMGPVDIAPPDQARRVSERIQRIEANETLVFESVQMTADGEEIPVEINARRITYGDEPAILSVARDISRRKERTRRLRTFERAVEQAGHAVYITDTDGTIEYVNPAFERVTGYDTEAILGETPAVFSTGDHDDSYYERLWETVLDGNVWDEQIENERADGERYYAEQTIAPIVDDGEVVNFVAIQQDITERKQRAQQLERYQQLIDNVPVGVYRNTPGLAGEFEEVNPAMLEMFDADSEAALLDTHVAELYRTPSQRELLTRKLEQEGRIVEETLRLETLDGEPFWAAVTAIRHETDGDVYYDGIIQDITERREQARKLRLREQRFRRLFEGHNAAMLLIDPDTGTIERANDAAVEFYGYDRETLTTLRIQEINQLDDEEIAHRREAADDGDENRFIFPHELADGEIRQVEVDSSPVHTGEQRVLFSIIHDVTERERNRERLERQNEQLEVLNRVVRHDIRNDMTVVLSHAELLAEHVEKDGNEHLESITEHGEHAVELTKTVRELMETMLDDGTVESQAFTLSDVLIAEVEDADAGHDAAEFTVAGTIPDVRVTGDEMLSSVFRNILTNAVQHSDVADTEVTITTEETADSVVVSVADNGPGVPDSQKEAIFGKGERGIDSPGTGLGLYLVHTFVEQYGGEVWVTDNEPRGAVFHIELPKADPQ
ncbi:MAG: PAS domain S-box protein [Haloarculaceae archaeon]